MSLTLLFSPFSEKNTAARSWVGFKWERERLHFKIINEGFDQSELWFMCAALEADQYVMAGFLQDIWIYHWNGHSHKCPST